MEVCCFCIPLLPYGVVFGFFRIIVSIYNIRNRNDLSKMHPLYLDTWIMSNFAFGIAAVCLIFGIFLRRDVCLYDGYLRLNSLGIILLLIVSCASAAKSYPEAALFFAQLIATCFLAYPVSALYYKENNDENPTESTV